MTAAASSPSITPAALTGLKVIELGQLIAGPFAAKTLADFGAEVIKPVGWGEPANPNVSGGRMRWGSLRSPQPTEAQCATAAPTRRAPPTFSR